MRHVVIEGTWEEIARRADEFKGKRVRLMILEEPALASGYLISEENPLDAIVGMASSGDGNLSELHDEVPYQRQ